MIDTIEFNVIQTSSLPASVKSITFKVGTLEFCVCLLSVQCSIKICCHLQSITIIMNKPASLADKQVTAAKVSQQACQLVASLF